MAISYISEIGDQLGKTADSTDGDHVKTIAPVYYTSGSNHPSIAESFDAMKTLIGSFAPLKSESEITFSGVAEMVDAGISPVMYKNGGLYKLSAVVGSGNSRKFRFDGFVPRDGATDARDGSQSVAVLSSGSIEDNWEYYEEIGGSMYKTVEMPDGKTWMAENLDMKFIGLIIGGSASTTEPRANYYDNDEMTYGKSGNRYGLLYNSKAVEYLENNKSSLIPGWHVSNYSDWNDLITAIGGTSAGFKKYTGAEKLKSASGWTTGAGQDDYGFNAVPAGQQSGGSFYALGTDCAFRTPNGADNNYSLNSSDNFIYITSLSSSNGSPVRLVKDS